MSIELKRHKFAEVFESIAKGNLEEYECIHATGDYWRRATDFLVDLAADPDEWKVRTRVPMHVVNGYRVPVPYKGELDPVMDYYISSITALKYYVVASPCWQGALAIERGIIHKTKEAAIANAKAMLGIDPNS